MTRISGREGKIKMVKRSEGESKTNGEKDND